MSGRQQNLLVSFSGGETSGCMTYWILQNWQERFDNIEVVFANTGEEHEETLEFVHRCDEVLGFNTTWVEANVHHNDRKGSTHKIVDFGSASRDGEPFEEVIRKYGIPNPAFPHCTRELKTNPISSYVENDLGWNDYWTAIGIRTDEVDRVDPKYEEKKYLYPFCKENPTSKKEVNAFWDSMPFRVELKGYEGNCKACWKKSFRKLMTIADENPSAFENFREWEKKYESYTPESRTKSDPPYRFYRNNHTVSDIMDAAQKKNFVPAHDDTTDTAYQRSLFDQAIDAPSGGCSDHCEPF